MNLSKYFTKEVRIGIAGITALCVLVYGINYLKGIHLFKPTSYFFVKYSNINGLSKSSPVFADGFKIGIVRDIHYDYHHPGNVTVEVELDQHMQIPKGSSAELVTEMLGTVKMNILLTSNPESYNIGDTIPGTTNNGLMETVTSIVPKLEELVSKLNVTLDTVQSILVQGDIPTTLTHVKNTAANLDVTTKHLASLMRNDIPQITSKINTIGDNLIDITGNLKEIDYEGTFRKIDETIANVKLFTEKLNSKDSSLGLLLNDREFYDNLNATTENAASLLEDLQTNPKRYVHFSIFGRKQK